jgi:hypothetical protein
VTKKKVNHVTYPYLSRVTCPSCKNRDGLREICDPCQHEGEVIYLHKNEHEVEIHALRDYDKLLKDGYSFVPREKIPVQVTLKVEWMRVTLDDVVAAYLTQQASPAPAHVEWFIDPIKEVVIFNLTW